MSLCRSRAIFGGHINYISKQVSFYGPNDEYILTGSDSGHIYIFDRKRGEHWPLFTNLKSSRDSASECPEGG